MARAIRGRCPRVARRIGLNARRLARYPATANLKGAFTVFHPSRLISMVLLALLPAVMASAENVVDPLVRYSTDYDGREHHLRITASSTRVTTPDDTFRVSTRMVLQYDCHEVAPLHPGRSLQAEAWHFRLPADAKAAVSVESPAQLSRRLLQSRATAVRGNVRRIAGH